MRVEPFTHRRSRASVDEHTSLARARDDECGFERQTGRSAKSRVARIMSRAHALAARAPTSDARKRWRARRSSSSRRLETRASSEASVRARGVSYAPAGAGTPVLVNVDATLPKRGLTLIVGRSGAGKSTLLTLIAGLSEPTSGTLEVGEEAETTRTTPAAERARRTGIVFQFPERHFLGRTVMQELTFGWPTSANAFASRRELAYRMNDALHAVGMERVALDTEVRTLSGGYKRRLALAIQLVRNPRVLCLDEPLAGLDWQTRAELTALLDELKRDRAVVVVSHDVEEIQPITDRAFRMTTHGALADVSDELAGARARAYGEASDAFPSFD